MTIFRQALRTYLLSKTGITDIVGAEGVYGYLAPQDAPLPYIVITRIGGGVYANLGASANVDEEFWQVSAFAKTDLTCEELKNQIVTALNLHQPVQWAQGLDTYVVHNVALDDGGIGGDIEEPDRDGSEGKIIQKPLTFRVLRNTNPT